MTSFEGMDPIQSKERAASHLRRWLHGRGDVSDRVPHNVADQALPAEQVHRQRQLGKHRTNSNKGNAELNHKGRVLVDRMLSPDVERGWGRSCFFRCPKNM